MNPYILRVSQTWYRRWSSWKLDPIKMKRNESEMNQFTEQSTPTLLGELESDKIQSSITAIATSRDTPHILVGTRDDSIIVITPSYVGSQRQKLCRERRKDQKARLKEIKSEEGELFSANFYGKDNSIILHKG